jgi:hypothetical protein
LASFPLNPSIPLYKPEKMKHLTIKSKVFKREIPFEYDVSHLLGDKLVTVTVLDEEFASYTNKQFALRSTTENLQFSWPFTSNYHVIEKDCKGEIALAIRQDLLTTCKK